MKAIEITADNSRKLAGQYDIPELEMKGAIGFWLVAPFGQDARPEGFLKKEKLLGKFQFAGKLNHGWFEIVELPPGGIAN